MRINDDLSPPVVVHAGGPDWVPGRAAGVDQKMLYREGAEVARVTSIVRYALGSAVPAHVPLQHPNVLRMPTWQWRHSQGKNET